MSYLRMWYSFFMGISVIQPYLRIYYDKKSLEVKDFKALVKESGSYLLSHLVGQYHRRW